MQAGVLCFAHPSEGRLQRPDSIAGGSSKRRGAAVSALEGKGWQTCQRLCRKPAASAGEGPHLPDKELMVPCRCGLGVAVSCGDHNMGVMHNGPAPAAGI